MKIKIETFGGVAGIVTSKEIEAEKFPPSIMNKIRDIFNDKKHCPMKTPIPKGAADHFNYRITLRDGTGDKTIECNEYNIDNDVKDLVSYVKTYSKKH